MKSIPLARDASPVATPLHSLPPTRLGPLTMRNLPIPVKPFGVSLLHESLLPFSETPSIYHQFTDEIVFVLSGNATVFLDERPVRVEAGDTLLIPAGAVHRLLTRRARVEALSLFAPPFDTRHPDVRVVNQAPRNRAAKRSELSSKRGAT